MKIISTSGFTYPVLIVLFLILSGKTYSQATITGIISDSITGENLEYTSVALYNVSDTSLVAGTVTNHFGSFSLKVPKSGKYYFTAHFIGYEPKKISGLIVSSSGEINLGKIYLNLSNYALEQVNISGERAVSMHRLDRQIYNATKFQSSEGGNAVDILRNMPSIAVGINSEITVRGATGFMLLINGKPVQSDPVAYLQQLPANAIHEIEIITTPSAKYDPDGKAGIINVRTKIGAEEGVYLLVNTKVGPPSLHDYQNADDEKRYGGDFTLNYRRGKWDLSAGADYNRDDLAGRRVGFVSTKVENRYTEFPSDGERSFDNYNYSGRSTLQYTPGEHDNFSVGFYAGKRNKYRIADILYHNIKTDVLSGGLISDLKYFNANLQTRKGDFLIGSFDYAHLFDNKSKISASLLYEYTMLGGPTFNLNLGYPNILDTIQYTVNDNENPLKGYRANLDYLLPLAGGTFEAGYQFRMLDHSGDFIYEVWDSDKNAFESNNEFSNSIDLERVIHSLYSQFSGKKEKLEYSAGLRLEYMDRQVKLGTEPEAFIYNNFGLFPSANILYRLNEDWSLKAGYSRRVERTTTFKMNPFPEREHSETLEQGDAHLLPEYIDIVEAWFVKKFGVKNSFFANGYYRKIQNVINRVNSVYNDTILNRIYTNAGRAQAFGIEAGTEIDIFPWWNIYAGANIYRYSIEGELFNNAVNTSDLIYSVNVNTTFKLDKTTNFQWNLNYISKRITAQGEDGAFLSPNASLKKHFFKGRLSASVQWINMDLGLLNTNEQRITTWGENFYTTTNYIYETDVIMFNLSYKINQPAKNIRFTKVEFGEKEF